MLPMVATAQTTTPLINKTTKVWVSPTAAEIATANFYGLTTNPLSQFAATTSAQLAGVISNETGSGVLVFGTSPTFGGTSTISGASSAMYAGGSSSRVGLKTHANGNDGFQSYEYLLGGTDEKNWSAIAQSGVWDLRADSDNLSSASIAIRITRSGVTITGGTLRTGTGSGTVQAGWNATSFYLGNAAVPLTGWMTDPNADRIGFWDDSAGSTQWLSLSGLTITGTSLSVDQSSDTAAGKIEIATAAETITGSLSSHAVTPFGLKSTIAAIPRLLYNETQTSGTNGGTFTSGAWQTRTLNVEAYDNASIGSLSSNQITLPQGTYLVRWSTPAHALVERHQSRLYNVTDTVAVSYGQNSRGSDEQTFSQGTCILVVSGGSKAYRIEHRCETTVATSGLGVAMGFGTDEVYTTVDIQKID